MPDIIWLLFVVVAGWAAGEIVGGDEYGRMTDVLFGLVGAFLVRFVVDISGVSLHDVYLLLFSVWGAAVVPGTFRFLRRSHHTAKFKDYPTPSLR